MLGSIILQEPPFLCMLEIEVKLGRLDEMRSQDVLQLLRVHVLIEDITVAQTVTGRQLYLVSLWDPP